MTTAFVGILVASLLGSAHCVGMCGPLVAVAVGDSSAGTLTARLSLQVAYHVGRLLSYVVVGLICGIVGAGINWSGSMLGVQRLAASVVGGMMILVGIIGILHYAGVRAPHMPGGARLQRLILAGQRAAMRMRPLPRAGAIGLLTALLPCGWLYVFAIVAAGTGSAALGGAVMAVFWVGTVPLLALFGISVQTLVATLGRRVPLAISAIVILLGMYTLTGRLTISAAAFEPSNAVDVQASIQQQVETIAEQEPPCCRAAKK